MGIRVFDLSLVITNLRKNAYFVEPIQNGAGFNVYSCISTNGYKKEFVDRFGKVRHGIRLDGADTTSGKYFSFALDRPSYYNDRASVQQGILKMKIKTYLDSCAGEDVRNFINGNPSVDKIVPVQFGVNKATSFEFYVIAKLVNGVPVFSSGPKVHTAANAARTEAQRLATANPGSKFVVFKATDAVSVGATLWESA